MTPLWVFGYGSLIWDPGFAATERVIASLSGWHRSFCMWSIHHRGTPEAPGLVLALDALQDAHCKGVAFRVAPGTEARTLQDLRARELVSSAYIERVLPVELLDGRRIEAVTYVVDPKHAQYTGTLSMERQAEIISGARGGRGENCAYLWSTSAHLAELGIEDPELGALAARVRALRGGVEH
jgi:cation transport protein ChaC